MTTIINNPGPSGEVVAAESSAAGVITGVIIAIVIIAAFIIWGLPALRQNQQPQQTPQTTNVNITTPLVPSTQPQSDTNSKPAAY